ncbi:MAG: ATP-dependent Clp protease adaptor ClpS [Planctomycetota bacterium]|nr:MAG: ATP-dependent Clp protease adaptor ClpS [Planctomycetota bacterium]
MAEQATSVAPAKPQPREEPDPEQPRLWRVVLLDDDDHSYEYVVEMLGRLFGFSVPKAFRIAQTVDSQGRATLIVTHREHAELKQEQIHSYGADPLIASCKGSMRAILEPADLGDEDDEDELDGPAGP